MPDSTDPFATVCAATNRHRASHGCSSYPFDDGRLLGVVAAATQARRILELGTALGYSALWLAHGAPQAMVDTIDRDPEHVRIAREHIAAHGMDARITVHEGEFGAIIASLKPGYDLGFFDGHTPAFDHLDAFERLLRPRGVLISTNLSHRGSKSYRERLFGGKSWLTSYVDAERDTALSVRL